MTIPRMLSEHHRLVTPDRKWDLDWYSYFDKFTVTLGVDLSLKVQGPASSIDGQWAIFDGTSGKLLKTGRRVLTGPLTIYIREGGDGTGFGLIKGATAWGTWQGAIDWVDDNVWTNGFDVTFAQDDTATLPDTYAPAADVNVIALSTPLPGGGARIFQGSSGADDDVRLDASGTANCIFISGENVGAVRFTNKFRISASGGFGIEVRAFARVNNAGTLYFVTCSGSFIQLSQDGAYFANDGTLKFEADVDEPLRIDSGTFHDNNTITNVGGRTYTSFWRGDFFSQGYLGSNVTGAFTGKLYDLRDGAVLRLFGAIPGSLPGVAEPGTTLSVGGISQPILQEFWAYNSADDLDVTGDGTAVTVDLDSEWFDYQERFSADTFTAQNDGFYGFSGCISLDDLTTGTSVILIEVVTTGQVFDVFLGVATAVEQKINWSLSNVDMAGGDTAFVRVTCSGTAKIVDILSGRGETFFMGKRVA